MDNMHWMRGGMKAFLQEQMNAIVANPSQHLHVMGQDDTSLLVVDAAQKKIVLKYLKLACNAGKDIEEIDKHKLKVTTFLLHLNDIPHIDTFWFTKAVVKHDLTMSPMNPNNKFANNLYPSFNISIPHEMQVIDTRTCATCFKVGQKRELKKCGNCYMRYYCNEDCQRRHWCRHKVECRRHKSKAALLKAKRLVAWEQVFAQHISKVHDYFDDIERKYKKKSKVLVLYSVESVEDNLTLFRFAPVSIKFLTEFSYAVVSGGQEAREKAIGVQRVLKAKKSAFLIVLPFNGDFSVFSLDLG